MATFIECVREESSVYPRPMARENLANDPFRMNAEAVEAAFAEARAQGRADDIERVGSFQRGRLLPIPRRV
ncbi:MAG: hypothetical protein ACLTDR_09765 [Adlercreutzia equolifaciens]